MMGTAAVGAATTWLVGVDEGDNSDRPPSPTTATQMKITARAATATHRGRTGNLRLADEEGGLDGVDPRTLWETTVASPARMASRKGAARAPVLWNRAAFSLRRARSTTAWIRGLVLASGGGGTLACLYRTDAVVSTSGSNGRGAARPSPRPRPTRGGGGGG